MNDFLIISRWACVTFGCSIHCRSAFCYTPGEMHEVLDGILRTNDPDIAVPLADAFEE
jgi:hypothetical protein